MRARWRDNAPARGHSVGRRFALAASQRVRSGLARAATSAQHSEFFADGGTQRAAAASYQALLSLFPLAVVTGTVFGLIVDDHVARARVIGVVLDQLPLPEGRGRTDLRRC